MTGKGSKPIAIVLVAVVVAAGLGYWLLIPKMPSQATTYTTEQTSLMSSSQTVPQTWTASSTVTSSTTLAETVAWINITASHPVSFYLNLLESNGTEPYVSLAGELRKLPDLKNATAVARIAYLALNATNPEVKEAFELMIKGGTPDPRDFTYSVPNYNTELQVLYWLALRNEFKKDDTLALAIAMVNGLWVTIGNEDVQQAVKTDTSDLLAFFRETSSLQLQEQPDIPSLEDYPLEAKVVLVDRTGKFPNNQVNTVEMGRFNARIAAIDEYEMSNVSLETLRKAKDFLHGPTHYLVGTNPAKTFSYIEKHFYETLQPTKVFSPLSSSWRYIDWREPEAREVGRGDVDRQFEYFWENGYFRGGCADNAQVVNAFGMSIGIAVNMVYRIDMVTGQDHAFPIYYEPVTRTWQGHHGDFIMGSPKDWSDPQVINIFRPPVRQKDYFDWRWVDRRGYVNAGFFAYCELPSFEEFVSVLSGNRGIATSQMKQWLLYS